MSKKRLLVVEDDKGIRDFLELQLADYDVRFATNQHEAFELLSRPKFDLVLLDLRLPRDSGDLKPTNEVGIDILKWIRANMLLQPSARSPLPVIVMTAYGTEEVSAEVLVTNGANDYVVKPFRSPEELSRKIERAVAADGALVSVNGTEPWIIRVACDDDRSLILVEQFSYTDPAAELVRKLRDVFVIDQEQKRDPDRFSGISSPKLAKNFCISPEAFRQRVESFRNQVTADFRTIRRAIGPFDLIDSTPWHGYRLNPVTVRLVDLSVLDR